MTDVRKERIPLLWSTARERWPKVFVLTWGVRSILVSAEERSFLERMYTQREDQRKRQEMIQRRCSDR